MKSRVAGVGAVVSFAVIALAIKKYGEDSAKTTVDPLSKGSSKAKE
jgi:hypothetical protein